VVPIEDGREKARDAFERIGEDLSDTLELCTAAYVVPREIRPKLR
jgi:hypothetical protein